VIVARCARWLEDIDAAIPTVVITARADGADVVDVSVTIDGVRVLESLDGKPLSIEPGEHMMRYVRAGGAPVDARVLVAAGEKNRLLAVEFPSTTTAATAMPTPTFTVAPTLTAASTEAPRAGVSPLAWVFTGAAVVAAGSFAYFGATGRSELHALRDSCAGHCDDSAVSAAWNKLIVADVSLGVGVASLGVATYFFLSSRRSDEPARPEAASSLVVAPGAHGVALGWRGVF
jgi:hypothetical protein